jgi:hypothetical protein
MQRSETVRREFRPFMPQGRVEIASRGYVGGWREYNNGLDFPLTAHAGRELFPGSLFRVRYPSRLGWLGVDVVPTDLKTL